ncbi:MAG: PEP-CTERM sorting domain-containing protein, partial [Pirellulaceae bacterium]
NGGGSVNMSGNNARIAGDGAGSILTNVDNTISGTGNAGTNSVVMINQGTFQAGAGESLTIDPVNLGVGNAAFTNSGVVRATGGGLVTLTGFGNGEFHGAPGGLFEAQASSRIDLISGAVVRNATFSTVGDGLIRVNAGNNATWVDVTNTGNFRKDDNGTLTIATSLTNSGNMQFVGGGNVTQMFVSGPVNLNGGGSVNMSGNNARIAGDGAGSILTNVDNTISGTGNAGTNSVVMINQGTFQAGAGESLTIDPVNLGANPSFTNNGVVRATGGGTVVLTGNGAGQFSGNGTFEALNGSNVLFDGSAFVQNISGGTLNSGTWRAIDGGAGASVRVQNNATSQINTIGMNAEVELAGVNSQFTVRSTNIAIDTTLSTVNGTLILRDGRDMTLSGGLTNNGSLQVDGAASSLNVTAGFQQNSGSTTLTNGGVLALNGSSNNIDGGTLEGIGNVIGDLTFGTAATLNPGFSPGQLDFTGDLTWDDGGLVFFDLGTNAPTTDFLAITGSLIKGVDGTFAFTFVNNNWVAGQTYDLISFASTTFSEGDFSYTNGAGFAGTFAITGGNLLQFNLISAVPEPGMLSVLLLAGIAGSSMVRRRRKQLD